MKSHTICHPGHGHGLHRRWPADNVTNIRTRSATAWFQAWRFVVSDWDFANFIWLSSRLFLLIAPTDCPLSFREAHASSNLLHQFRKQCRIPRCTFYCVKGHERTKWTFGTLEQSSCRLTAKNFWGARQSLEGTIPTVREVDYPAIINEDKVQKHRNFFFLNSLAKYGHDNWPPKEGTSIAKPLTSKTK